MRHNTRALANVTPLQVAVAEAAGSAELYDYLLMSASGSLHYDESLAHLQRARMGAGDIAPRGGEAFEMRRFQVETATIDACLAGLGVAGADLVKMDIEGAELGALRGMRDTIAASPGLMLVMEYNPGALKAFGHDPAAALDEALGMGFSRVEAIEADGSLRDWRDARLVNAGDGAHAGRYERGESVVAALGCAAGEGVELTLCQAEALTGSAVSIQSCSRLRLVSIS